MKTLKEILKAKQLNDLQQISFMIRRGDSTSTIMANWERFLADPQMDLKGMKQEDAKTLVEEVIEAIEKSVGDDAQLANADMQNKLQKQQQTLQMVSKISKMMRDTAMSVIRKMGG